MKDRLQVIWNKRLVGTLDRHKKGSLVFQYSQDWIGTGSSPVSLSLPCRKEKFAPAISTAFFENLLPESNTRTVLAFQHRRMMAFNYIIGNHDAHGKNFSIIHNRGFELAPFYDLVSTQVYPLDNKFAMAIGQTFRLDRIKEHSFKKFAMDMNVRPKLLTSLVTEVCEAVKNELDGLLAEHDKNYGEARIYKDLNEIIKSNIIQLQYFFREFLNM